MSEEVSSETSHRLWLPGLDGLRALAALAVVVHHEEQARDFLGLPSAWRDNFAIVHLGSLGVSLFFVLSGFLITLLLLREHQFYGKISVKKFYLRRVLRIWPLYYLIVILGFFVIPLFHDYAIGEFPKLASENFWWKLLLYAIFAPHVAAATVGPIGYAGVLWSVGVEEWFYLIWPWLVTGIRRLLVPLLLAVILTFGYVRWNLLVQLVQQNLNEGAWHSLFVQLRFDCMAVGALGALLCAAPHRRLWIIKSPLFSRTAQVVILAALIYFLWSGKHFLDKDEAVYSLFFLWLIINVSYNERSIINIDTKPMRFLGKVSYGIYCYNWITIVTALLILRALGVNPEHGFPRIFSYLFGAALTIAIAALSYRLIERPFLAWKDRSFGPGLSAPRSDGKETGRPIEKANAPDDPVSEGSADERTW